MVGSIFLLVVYLVVFIVQITLLVKSIKRKENKYWIQLFSIEIIFIGISLALWIYYESLPGYGLMPGLSYLGEVLLCFGASILYSAMLFITTCSKIIIFEKNQKEQGKKHVNPIVSIIALIFIVIGIVSLSSEIIDNWGKKETIGTVVGFEEEGFKYFYIDINGNKEERISYAAIVSFEVSGNKYQDEIYLNDAKIGDKIEIAYISSNSTHNPYILRYFTDNKEIYIPAFLIGALIIIFRFRKCIFKSKIDK